MNLPRHVAIVMDGNGRWANNKGLPRTAGHKVGVESVRTVVKVCVEKKIEVLTLFVFSTENWQRPQSEVDYLLNRLFITVLKKDVAKFHKNNIQLRIIGDRESLAPKLQQKIAQAEQLTAKNSGLKVMLALNYSGRWDIIMAAQRLGQEIALGKLTPQDITIAMFQKYTCCIDLPEPDLLIRTGGEQRISNFILWQLAYTELYFTKVLWPDFREEDFTAALLVYSKRIRRFGKC